MFIFILVGILQIGAGFFAGFLVPYYQSDWEVVAYVPAFFVPIVIGLSVWVVGLLSGRRARRWLVFGLSILGALIGHLPHFISGDILGLYLLPLIGSVCGFWLSFSRVLKPA